MNFLGELRSLILSLTYICIALFIGTLFFFIFGIKNVEINHVSITLPLPTEDSFSAQLFKKIVSDIAPRDIPLIVTSPFSAFGAELKVAFLLALLAVFPFMLFRILTYLKPALHEHELSFIYKIIIPASLLFLAGAVFAYFFILPPTFGILYAYTKAIDVTPMLAVDDFISMVTSLILITGFAFTLPIVMILLSAVHVIKSDFWVSNWRYAVLFFLIVSAIITPDGSGVSMILLTIPLCVLYGSGVLASMYMEKS